MASYSAVPSFYEIITSSHDFISASQSQSPSNHGQDSAHLHIWGAVHGQKWGGQLLYGHGGIRPPTHREEGGKASPCTHRGAERTVLCTHVGGVVAGSISDPTVDRLSKFKISADREWAAEVWKQMQRRPGEVSSRSLTWERPLPMDCCEARSRCDSYAHSPEKRSAPHRPLPPCVPTSTILQSGPRESSSVDTCPVGPWPWRLHRISLTTLHWRFSL